MRQARVYVLTGEGHGCKIGYSLVPIGRAGDVAREKPFEVDLAFKTDPLPDAPAVETMAHWLLRKEHIGGEWFDVTASAAVEAVEEAIALVDAGEKAPRRINNARPFTQLKESRLQIVISEAEKIALDKWRFSRRIWSRSEAIRQLIATGIQEPVIEDDFEALL